MLNRKLNLIASASTLRFSDGTREVEYQARLFLNEAGLIAGVGSRPPDNDNYTEVELFSGATEKSFDYLVAAINYGLQQFKGRLYILPGHLLVSVSPDLVRLLRGFEAPIFEKAGQDAGASRIEVSRSEQDA